MLQCKLDYYFCCAPAHLTTERFSFFFCRWPIWCCQKETQVNALITSERSYFGTFLPCFLDYIEKSADCLCLDQTLVQLSLFVFEILISIQSTKSCQCNWEQLGVTSRPNKGLSRLLASHASINKKLKKGLFPHTKLSWKLFCGGWDNQIKSWTLQSKRRHFFAFLLFAELN